MSIRKLRHALLIRTGRADDRGSIALLMMVIVAGAALGSIMMVSTVNQAKSSTFDITRVHELDAAQTGIDLVLGNIRAATSSTDVTVGDSGKLPCGPWTGTGTASGATYNVTIGYYLTDPTESGASPMLCTSAGPYDPSTQTRTPRYALITSSGTDGISSSGASSGRTIQTTYVFQTDDVNITGGQIRIFPAGSSQYCMDAGSSPGVGTPVLLQSCSTSNPPIDQQVWEYRSDLSIELVESASSTSNGLCIDTSPTTHAAGDAIVLKTCSVADASVCPSGYTPSTYATAFPGKTCSVSSYNQQWSVDDSAHLQGSKTDQSDLDGYCINAGSQAASVALTLQSCAGSVSDTAQTWVPSPTTGAGMAGAGNNQLVNFKQFATCLDVTGQDVTSAFLILYTCKQNPNPTKVLWNQKFVPSPALGTAPTQTMLKVTSGSTTYCLKSPLTTGGYPVLSTPCPSSLTAAAGTGFVWTVYQKYSDSAGTSELSYANKYTIKDANSKCLSPGQNSDLWNSEYYKAIVTNCNGSTLQKWNASPSLDAATLTDTHEISSSGS